MIEYCGKLALVRAIALNRKPDTNNFPLRMILLAFLDPAIEDQWVDAEDL